MPRLSILILTIPKRRIVFNSLMYGLKEQAKGHEVQILSDDDPKATIGLKRQRLLEQAAGDYIVYIDDDDQVNRKYVALIVSALEDDPDCVGIQGRVTGVKQKGQQWYISKDYEDWHEQGGIYYRHTNHLAPVRRSIALEVGFQDKMFGEDHEYSMGLRGLLQTEVKVETNIYLYRYVRKK